MPNIPDQIRLTPAQDRRRKLTDGDKKKIRNLYKRGGFSMRALAGKFQVSKRLIQFVIYPERLAKLHAQVKLEKRWLKYYDREKHNRSVKNLRSYKRELHGIPTYQSSERPTQEMQEKIKKLIRQNAYKKTN